MKTFKLRIPLAFDLSQIEEVEWKPNPENLRVIRGYIYTFDNPDKHGDRIWPGLFTNIRSLISRGQYIPLYINHSYDKLVGLIDPSSLVEDDIGLIGTGVVDVSDKYGRAVFAGILTGEISHFSFAGFIHRYGHRKLIPGGNRVLLNGDLIEVSLVDDPINLKAKIIDYEIGCQTYRI